MKPFIKTVLGWFSKLKNIQVIALIVGAPIFTILSLVYMGIVVFRPWAESQQGLQLEILRDGIMYVHGLLFVTILALTAGLIRSVKVGAGKFFAELDLADEYDGKSPYQSNGEQDFRGGCDDRNGYGSSEQYGPPFNSPYGGNDEPWRRGR